MIDVYINGEQRPDLRVVTGGSLDQTEAHVTSSAVSVALDIGAEDLREYDYIRFSENSKTVFAGTILSISQQDLGNPALSYKVYDLVLASNADYLANVFVDMSFPSGANVTQILLGNHPGDDWYDAGLGEFYGIVPVRVVARVSLSALLTISEMLCYLIRLTFGGSPCPVYLTSWRTWRVDGGK